MVHVPDSGERRNVFPYAVGVGILLALCAALGVFGWARFQEGLEEAAKAVPSL